LRKIPKFSRDFVADLRYASNYEMRPTGSTHKRKPKCLIFGASHAKKFYEASLENQLFSDSYEILGSFKSGAKSTQLILPEIVKTFDEQDLIIVLAFGNDIFEKHILITKNPFTIHLTQFIPVSPIDLKEACTKFEKQLIGLKCKIKIIDNIYRHLNCCEKHIHMGIAKYQKDSNTLIRDHFGKKSINHLYLLENHTYIRKASVYANLLVDSVHLKREFYAMMSAQLIRGDYTF
jgi:hypothetical protein